MPTTITWLQDKRIIRQALIGQFDLKAATEAAKTTEEFLRDGLAPVHLIVDVTEMDRPLTNVRSVNSVMGFLKDPKLGWVVVVGANTVVKFVSSIVSQVTRFQLSNVSTIEDALTFLRKQDPSLNAEEVKS